MPDLAGRWANDRGDVDPGDRGRGNAFSWSIFNGGSTFASKIANAAAEFNNPKQTGAYIAAGLVLFILTFLVNAAARIIVSRDKLK